MGTDELLSFLAEGEVHVQLPHFSEPLGNTFVHGYGSAKSIH